MTHLFLVFSHFDTGGLQTAMVRMARWCKDNAHDCLIIFETCDEQMVGMCNDEGLSYLHSFRAGEIAGAVRERASNAGDEALVITFELPEFLFFERVRSQYLEGLTVHHIIYNVSVGSMVYGGGLSRPFARIVGKLNRLLGERMRDCGQLYFMDEETRDAAFDGLGLEGKDDVDRIIPLPMFVSPEPSPRSLGSFEGGRTILSVARAAFPFKGYLLGLVDSFPIVHERYPDIKLRIVSFGPDIGRLKDAIAHCPEPTRSAIELVGQSSTEQIREMLGEAWLYVGMGTTVLDAADVGVPAIVSCHHTEKDTCLGFFCDSPGEVAFAGEGVPSVNLIQRVADMDGVRYRDLAHRTYNAYAQTYDIERVMPRVFRIRETSGGRSATYFLGYLLFGLLRLARRRVLRL